MEQNTHFFSRKKMFKWFLTMKMVLEPLWRCVVHHGRSADLAPPF